MGHVRLMLMESEYILLRERIVAAGLLEKTFFYYMVLISFYIGLLVLSIFIFMGSESVLLAIGGMAFIVIMMVQLGLVGHDIAHQQVFRSIKGYEIGGSIYWNLLLGINMRYWNNKHGEHHAHPNQLGRDPDIELPVLFSARQVKSASALKQKMLKFQHIYFYPMMALPYLSVVIYSFSFLARQKTSKAFFEFLLLSAHHLIIIFLIFNYFSPGQALFLYSIYLGSLGIYMAMVFAPNHKGMPIIASQETFSYRHQILTSRNVRPNFFTDFWYGGLNYQIEHHLFPTMPRKNLKKTRDIVRQFCKEKNIPYHETGVWQSIREIHSALRQTAQEI